MNRILVFLPLAALFGCGPGDSDATALPSGPRTVDATEIEILPSEAGFAHIQNLVLAGDALWILDGSAPYLARISLTDSHTLRFGTEGQGPGELRGPWDIQPAPELDPAGVQVWDTGNNRVSTFDHQGTLVATDRLNDDGLIRARSDIREVTYADPFRIRNAGNGVVIGSLPGRIDRTADLGGGSLRLADRHLSPGAEVLQFADHMPPGAEGLKEWAALPLWDVCGDVVALWSPAASSVEWVGLDGEVRASAAVIREPEPITLDDVTAYLQWMARLELGPDFEKAGIDFQAVAAGSRDQFADLRPGATDLRCESENRVWLRLFGTSTDPLGRGHTWLRVSRNGTQEEFTFPLGFTPTVFTPQGGFGVLETGGGEQKVAWWPHEPG